MERNELLLMYQPKVSLRSSNVSAVEALIRWRHPDKGLIQPAHFIPFAEHTGYIKVLTHWVLGRSDPPVRRMADATACNCRSPPTSRRATS